MKFSVTSYNAVAVWKWDTHTSSSEHKLYHYARSADPAASGGYGEYDDDDDDEEDDDVCGICRLAFESTCPDCKVPGDDCPLSEFRVSIHPRMLSLMTLFASLGRVHACLPHALPTEMDRHRVVKGPMPNGPQTLGYVDT